MESLVGFGFRVEQVYHTKHAHLSPAAYTASFQYPSMASGCGNTQEQDLSVSASALVDAILKDDADSLEKIVGAARIGCLDSRSNSALHLAARCNSLSCLRYTVFKIRHHYNDLIIPYFATH
jgi:hypothetical protein